MTSIKEDHICLRCTHLFEFEKGCKAFPEGIPQKILISGRHFGRVKGQENNIVFEERSNHV